jgi:hypothetical protein
VPLPDGRRVRLMQVLIVAVTAALVLDLILVVQPWWSGRVVDFTNWHQDGHSPGGTWTLRKAQGGELLADWGEDWVQVRPSDGSSWRNLYWGTEADTTWGDENTLLVTPADTDNATYRTDVRSQSKGDAPPGPLLVGSAAAIVAVAGVATAFFVGWRARRRVVQTLVRVELERLEREPVEGPFAASEASRLAAQDDWRIARTEREMVDAGKPRRWRSRSSSALPAILRSSWTARSSKRRATVCRSPRRACSPARPKRPGDWSASGPSWARAEASLSASPSSAPCSPSCP